MNIKDVDSVNPPKFDRADDMAQLTHLNEASVVHNLFARYEQDLIYTYSGLFLVAINPYHNLSIYGEDYINKYKNNHNDELKPHIFAITDLTFRNMIEMDENQSILVTGESGAGKTENTKKIIQYLAAIAKPSFSPSSSTVSSDQQNNNIEEQILQANPILESFGNAQTVRNNNSSRFGKFIRIEFNSKGCINGGFIDWYLLEKSRVIYQTNEERNYHIFYQLINGSTIDMKQNLLLESNINDYIYLKNSNKKIIGINDTEEFNSLIKSFSIMGFSKKQYYKIFKIISVILRLGNINVGPLKSEVARISNLIDVEKICHLLGINSELFITSLINPKVKAGREIITQSRSPQQVRYTLDSLAKNLYEKIFGYIINVINNLLVNKNEESTSFIGVLDIAGFEIFKINSFEQLCINYTNEKLQQFFNHHMFILEQEEYNKESINWNFIDFGLDLQPTIDLIEKSNPIGIFSCLDEDCIVPKATDRSFTDKLNSIWDNKNSKIYKGSKLTQGFILKHYAANVDYNTEGWLEKNKDPQNENIISLLINSNDKFTSNLFISNQQSQTAKQLSSSKVKKGLFRTVAQKHKEQLNNLMQQLNTTKPHFVRCIIPNHLKQSKKFNNLLVLEQLRCNGVLEGIRIARSGYPNRLLFTDFIKRYQCLLKTKQKGYVEGKKSCELILNEISMDKSLYMIGLTKVFFKAGVLADLEILKEEMVKDVITKFQSLIRGIVIRKKIHKIIFKLKATKIIMNNFTIYLDLKDDKWWKLMNKMKPILSTTNIKNENDDKNNKEIIKLNEKIIEDKNLNEKLTLLSKQHEIEISKLKDLLISERSIQLDKQSILENAKIREIELEDQLDNALNELDQLELQCEELIVSKKKIDNQSIEWRKELENGTKLIKDLEIEKNNLSIKIIDFQKNLEDNRQLQSNQFSKSKKLNDDVQKLSILIDNKNKQINQLETQLNSLNSNSNLQSRINFLKSDYNLKNSKINEIVIDNKQLHDKLSNLYEITSEYENIVSEKEKEISNIQTNLNKTIDCFKILKLNYDDLKNQCKLKNQQFEKANYEMNDLKSKLIILEKEANESRKNLEISINDEHKHGNEKKQLDLTIQQLNKQIETLRNNLLNVKNKNISLISLKESKIHDLQRSINDLSLILNKLNDENFKTIEINSKLEEDKLKAKSRIENLSNQVLNLKNQLIENESTKEDSTEICKKIRIQIKNIGDRSFYLEDRLETIENERERITEQYCEMKVKFEEQSMMIKHTGIEKRKIDDELESIKSNYFEESNLKEKYSKELFQKTSQIEKLQKQLTSILQNQHERRNRSSLNPNLNENINGNGKLEIEYNNLKSQFNKLKLNHDKMIRQVEDLKHSIEIEKKTTRKSETLIESYQKKLTKLRLEKGEIDASNSKLLTEISINSKKLSSILSSSSSKKIDNQLEVNNLHKQLNEVEKKSKRERILLENQLNDFNKRWKADIEHRDRPRIVSRESLQSTNSISTFNSRFGPDYYESKLEDSELKCQEIASQLQDLLIQSEQANKANNSITNNNGNGNGENSLESAHRDLIEVYQEVSRNLSLSKSEVSRSKAQVLQLSRELAEKEQKLEEWKKQIGPEYASAISAKEELLETSSKMEILELKCEDLSKSYKLYKSRAEEYYGKLESAEVAVMKATRAEKFAKTQLNETIEYLNQSNEESRNAELQSAALQLKIRKLESDLDENKSKLKNSLDTQNRTKLELEEYRKKEGDHVDESENMLVNTRQKYHQRLRLLTEELDKKRKESFKLQSSTRDLKRTINDLKKNISENDYKIQSFTREKSRLLASISDLKLSKEHETKRREEADRKMGTLFSQVRNLKTSMNDLINECNKLKKDKKVLED